MDTNATPDPNPNLTPPDEPTTLTGWLLRNAISLVIIAAVAVVVCVKWDPATVALVGLGLGLVIFVHELGHFLAAKWCDVHVETFSIGFGPSIPGCRFNYGETTYMLALIPLGGYVKMVGEGSESEDGDEDPRSFKNKSVGQRMLIISAGVVMNVILAAVCFVFVYMTAGVEEKPGVVGSVRAGAPAWVAGVPSGAIIDRIGTKEKPWFDDIRTELLWASNGQAVQFNYHDPRTGAEGSTKIEPAIDREESALPFIGVISEPKLTLPSRERSAYPPTMIDSAASRAQPAFEYGDEIVAATDPSAGGAVTPLPPDPRADGSPQGDVLEFLCREQKAAGEPMIVTVRRGGQTVNITVPPAYTRTLGLRMSMGPVVAVRADSPAARTGVTPRQVDKESGKEQAGDTISAVEVIGPDGKSRARFVGNPAAGEQVLDPLRLPYELLAATADEPGKCKVKLTVLRQVGHDDKRPVDLVLDWDDRWRYERCERAQLDSVNSPCALQCLGLAYRVQTTVDAVTENLANGEGLRVGDVVKKVVFVPKDAAKEDGKTGQELGPEQWFWVFNNLQIAETRTVKLTVSRAGVPEPLEFVLQAKDDDKWPAFDRGIRFQGDSRLQKAGGVFEALSMGGRRTWNTIALIYTNLRAMAVGRVSLMSLSGPLTIGAVSYSIAGDNIFKFILFLGMINVNLAVINFLPIPVLDGGHMVFLIYEKLRGRPASEMVRTVTTIGGFAFIVCLMLFVIGLDVHRLWKLF